MRIFFDATYNSDTIEGRGPMVSAGIFTRREDAEKLDGRSKYHAMGVINPLYPAIKVMRVKVYHSMEDFDNNSDESIREKALSKLTDADKLVLGLK